MAARKGPRVVRRTICLGIHLSLTIVFCDAYNVRYGNHIDCFNELGRCYVPGEGVLTTAGAMWGVFAVVFAALALMTTLILVVALVRHRRATGRGG